MDSMQGSTEPQMPQQQSPSPTQQKERSNTHEAARNFFLYFLTFAMLYMIAINIGGILFEIVDKHFSSSGVTYSGRFSLSSLRYHISSLIVSAPIFLFLAKKLYRDSSKSESLRKSAIRRWLTYITLLVTTLIVVGDLIALVNSLLKGDTTTQFILKSLIVLVIAASVLYYYLQDLKAVRDNKEVPVAFAKTFFIATIVISIATVVFGILSVTSPGEQRKINRDQERVNDLQQISYAIDQYSRNTGELPAGLRDVSIRNQNLVDPVTGQQYSYNIMSDTTYELCAIFETSNKDDSSDSDYYYGPEFLHDAGEVCFTRKSNALDAVVKPVPAL